ncbi:glycosyltransferase family 9 protein [Ktedonosporobacter rubrisoli]|uniref:Glycosyltransferase family 9 protein n=1 Tax=Ktedonosporobacter rubrisoli TaxID=2509675 RepID=A0A4P6JSG1_KTERU|nr:glycosyltransferase family 9 protein [Ktedonosporobacter rubrisoli]QBD78334.1 glycosyltransferase family 9 protein [Ktedonosporobacter rubrisoli]
MIAISRIALFRALNLGDLLVAVPTFRALRSRFPHAEITLIGLPWAATFVQRYSRYLDRFVEFAGYAGIAEAPYDPERSRKFVEEQRNYGYDLVVQMHGSGLTSNPFVLELGGRITAGYYENEPPDELTLGAPYPEDQHEIFRLLGLARLLGCRDIDPRLEFPLSSEDYTEVAALLRMLPMADRPWIGLHAGARPPARRWPTQYFARLADELAQHYDAQIILTGSQDDGEIAHEVKYYMRSSAIDVSGKTSLGGLAALLSKLDLFISNDTGPGHLAVAVDCPSITLFGPADYRRWAPLDQARHPVVRHPVPCSPCGYWECPIDHRCLRWIHPREVSKIAKRFLPETPPCTPRGSLQVEAGRGWKS